MKEKLEFQKFLRIKFRLQATYMLKFEFTVLSLMLRIKTINLKST